MMRDEHLQHPCVERRMPTQLTTAAGNTMQRRRIQQFDASQGWAVTGKHTDSGIPPLATPLSRLMADL